MGEISGFDWWFRNRDYVLRENLESLEASTAAAASRNARLSSQLSRLQGSLEHRLNALSSAFDAYVQLGDVREQLAAFSEAATIRRESLVAISALGDGRPATPVDDRGTGYWVAAATNALIARVSGAPDVAAEAALSGQEPDARWFLVAATGALGRGPEVAHSVASLLHSDDGRLDDHQLDLWQAVVRGDFGPELIGTVLAGWHDQLAAVPESEWWTWASEQGSKAGQDAAGWILAQAQASDTDHDQAGTTPTPSSAANDQASGGGGLRGLALELINSGFGEEKALLATARSLRSRIENPGIAPVTADDPTRQAGEQIVDIVRSTYAELQDSSARTAIFAAIAPFLVAAAEAQLPSMMSQEPAAVTVRVGSRPVKVTATGPDQAALSSAVAQADQWDDPAASKPRLYALATVAIACVVIAVVLIVIGFAVWLAVILLIVAVITGILAVRTVRAGRLQDERRQQEAAARDRSISDAKERAGQIDQAQREAARESADQLDRIRMLLAPEQQNAGSVS